MRPLLPLLLSATLLPAPALAQSIIPAADGTGTLVLPDGSTYQITGGTLSGDGANLFHSFEQFGLTAAEVANFLADPTVQNILGRVVGGNASVINGLLQVSGSSANLYLLNPAGILFGPNAALNLGGSFTATTASGLGFGENWLQAIGNTDYTALTGNPTAFTFGSQPGALINLGNLTVKPGEVITLASGAVINLGTLNAPGGQILVVAVPGENRVSIRPEGAILSLELATLPEGADPTAPLPFSPLDLPSLLRAGGPAVATGIAVSSDSTVSLPGSTATLPTTPGTALVSGTLDVAGETGGRVQVLGDRIATTAATIDASGTQDGGQILVGGEYQGGGTTPTASRTYVDANSTLRADALESGNGGEVILWADEGTRFDGTITARGGAAAGNGGFVEVSGRNTLAFNGQVDVSAAQGEFGTLLLDPTNITISAAASSPGVDAALPDILVGDLPANVTINATTLQNQAGDVILQATNNITIATGVSLTFVPGGSITFTADADRNFTGDFTMDPTQTIDALTSAGADGRDITITAANNITIGAIAGRSIRLEIPNANSTVNTNNISASNEVYVLTGSLTTGAISSGPGTLYLRASEIDLVGGPGSVQAPGDLFITSYGLSEPIILGGADDSGLGNLDLTATDLAALADGFSSIEINGGDIGRIALAPAAIIEFSDPLTLRAGRTVDTTGGTLTGVDNASLTLDAGTGLTVGAVTVNGGAVTLSAPTATLNQQITGSSLTGTVTTVNVGANGSVQDGVDVAVTGGTVNLATATYQEGARITLSRNVTLTGTGAGNTILDGNNTHGVIGVNGGVTANINNLTITNGRDGFGGGIFNDGNLTLTGTTISNNNLGTIDILPRFIGGGIYNSGTLTVTGSTFSGNEAGQGGGINNNDGSVTITNSTFSGNSAVAGGAILSFDSVTITGSTFSGNVSSSSGAIYQLDGPVSITNSTLDSVLASSSATVQLSGTITSTGNQAYFVPVTTTNLSLTGPSITFGGPVTANGNLTLITDSPDIQSPITGSGALKIQPFTPSLPITLGGTDSSAITFLNQSEINQLGNGFGSRTIGQVGNTGPITLEPFTLSSPLTIAGGVLTGPSQNTTWAIAPDGSLEVGGFGATLRLLNPTAIVGGSDAINTVLGSAGNDTFTIIGDGTARFGAVTFSNINAFDGGAGFDTVAGTGADDYFVVTSSSGGYILNSDFLQDISFSNVERLATGTGSDTVELQSVPLSLEVIGGDRLTLFGSPDVTLNANVTTPGSLDIAASGGSIAQTGGQVTVGGATNLFASGNIGLGGNNDFNTVSVTAAQNVVLRDRNNLQLNDLAFTGSLQATAAGDLTANTNISPGSGMAPMTLAASATTTLAVAAGELAAAGAGGVSLTSGGNLTTADITAPGSPIVLNAGGAITTGNLNSSGSNGGMVSLQAGNRIQVNSINAQGTTNGGTITALTPLTFRALGSFIDQNGIAASLSTVGGSRGGAITLGYGVSTFTLGDPSVNGTLAAITTGDVTLLPDLANPIVGSRVFGDGLPGQVQLISFGDIPIEIEPPPDDIDPVPDPVRNPEIIEEGGPVLLTSAGVTLGEEQFDQAEESAAAEFADYFGDLIKPPRPVSLAQAQATLRDIAAQTGEVPAFLYMRLNRSAKPGEGGVELLLITPEGAPSQVRVLNATVDGVLKAQEQLRRQITNPSLTNNTAYLAAAQQLYSWLIAPIAPELQAAEIDTIGFVMDANLRTLPLAALHNGERFLIEDYSIGLIPSLGLIDPTYVDLNRQNSTLVVSGASQFINQPPLLAAEVEMRALQSLWPSTKVAETNFTEANLRRDRRQAQIIHMATHAQFLRGAPSNSYLQFFDSRLRLNRVPELGWFDPQVELVTLSACQTAMGNTDAELGFAGFALLAGAKSALASLWKVSDEATTGLMTTFYQNLDTEAIKVEALRDAQLAMIQGQVYAENGQLIWPGGSLALPPDLVFDGRQDFSHPFYWAAFTMVGSPW